MSNTPHILAQAITCHAWNADRSKVALCPNNNEIHIYGRQGATFELEQVLKEHDESQIVTGIDWSPKLNRIVTSSQDRNAYVWTFQNGVWKPTLVILRINRAATSVRWSPHENKFAVSSGAKCVSVCYFEEDNDWWVSKHIKKHKSSVVKVDWHPSNLLLATASTDFKARVFCAVIKKGVDAKPQPPAWLNTKLEFGEPVCEFTAGAWVHSVKWSPSGNLLAFVAHDSTLNVADFANGQTVQTVKTGGLPFVDVAFYNENTIIAVGYDCQPVIFVNKGGWVLDKKLDAKAAPKTAAKNSAFDLFKSKVETGQNVNFSVLDTTHQNVITNVSPFQGGFSTSGLDGRLVEWKL